MLHRNLSNSLHHIQSQSCLYNYSDLNMGMEEGGGGILVSILHTVHVAMAMGCVYNFTAASIAFKSSLKRTCVRV